MLSDPYKPWVQREHDLQMARADRLRAIRASREDHASQATHEEPASEPIQWFRRFTRLLSRATVLAVYSTPALRILLPTKAWNSELSHTSEEK